MHQVGIPWATAHDPSPINRIVTDIKYILTGGVDGAFIASAHVLRYITFRYQHIKTDKDENIFTFQVPSY